MKKIKMMINKGIIHKRADKLINKRNEESERKM